MDDHYASRVFTNDHDNYTEWASQITFHGGLAVWMFKIEIERDAPRALHWLIGSIQVPDRDSPSQAPLFTRVRICTRRKLPRGLDERAFVRVVEDYVRCLVTHEMREGLQYRGDRVREDHPPDRYSETMRTQAAPLGDV